MTAINAEIAACHETAGIAQKENSSTSIIVRRGQATKHVFLGPVRSALRVSDEQVLHHGGHNVPGRDGIATNSVHTPFGSEIARQLKNSSFAGVVGRADQSLTESVRDECMH